MTIRTCFSPRESITSVASTPRLSLSSQTWHASGTGLPGELTPLGWSVQLSVPKTCQAFQGAASVRARGTGTGQIPGNIAQTRHSPWASADVYSNCVHHAISEERTAVTGISSKINFYFFFSCKINKKCY